MSGIDTRKQSSTAEGPKAQTKQKKNESLEKTDKAPQAEAPSEQTVSVDGDQSQVNQDGTANLQTAANADYGTPPWEYDGRQIKISSDHCAAARIADEMFSGGEKNPHKMSAQLEAGKTITLENGIELTLTEENRQKLAELEENGRLNDGTNRAEAVMQMAIQNALEAHTMANELPFEDSFVSREAVHRVSEALGAKTHITHRWGLTEVGSSVAYGEGTEKHMVDIVAENDGVYTVRDAYGKTWEVSEEELKQKTRGSKSSEIGYNSAIGQTSSFYRTTRSSYSSYSGR
ncbi:MAG: hypothetical protein VKN33_08865 [Candidatus Sericytochromatia bacterium]|nr:hypothetical protein [Candidatus Sericytochromatia bacterium]